MDLTQERLRYVVSFDADTGIFTRLTKAAQCVTLGEVAGGLDTQGYVRINIDGKKYLAHRLAWLYEKGTWPRSCIDHINGDRKDNRMKNLREASHSQNMQNQSMKNGSVGTCYHKAIKKWQSYIYVNRRQIQLGYFETQEQAHSAYLNARRSNNWPTNEARNIF